MTNNVLEVENLAVVRGGRTVLRDVGFTIAPGMFCGLIGGNGAGKTSLLRAISGLEPPLSGTVRLPGAPGYVPQKIALDPDLPVRARDLVGLGLDGNRFGLPWPTRARTQAVDDMLRAVEALDFANERIGRLSGGQQQRVLIAHALIRRPRLLLLDEPLANLDLRAAAGIVRLLRHLCTEMGVGVLLSAHDMNPLLGAMDQIVYLANGHAASGPTQQVVRTETLSALYGYHIDVIRVHGRILVVAGEPGAQEGAHVAAIP